MFCGNYILSGILDKCYIFIKNNKNVEVDLLTTPTFIIEPIKGDGSIRRDGPFWCIYKNL